MVLRLLVVLSNLLTRQWLKPVRAMHSSRVSVLIPARNEAGNIGLLLERIVHHDYRELEVIVYDDLSTDDTPGIVREFAHKDPRIRLISGRKMLSGWLGKNNACHHLSEQARGDYLLFLDADVRINEGLIGSGLNHMEQHRLDLLSLFPRQIMKGIGEKLSVPAINWILLSLLPLKCTKDCRHASLSAANGQFMLFKASTYRKYLFHQRFRMTPAEDIAISRFMKKEGLRIHTLLGGKLIECRMYTSLKESLDGFSRNLPAFFGNSMPAGLAFAVVTTLGVLPVALAMGTWPALAYLGAGLAIRMLVSWQSGQSICFNALTAPLQQGVLFWMSLKALVNKQRKQNIWKGRYIDKPLPG